MIEEFHKNVPIQKFLSDAKSIKIQNATYLRSYKEFIEYFREINTISLHHLVIGINFTYGWMPTAFDFRSDQFDESLVILNDAKRGTIPNENEIRILQHLFNNSLVGTSKLLHFINPHLFAIWDSWVYRYLTGKPPYDYRLNKYESYIRYHEFCSQLISVPEYEIVHKKIEKIVGYPMTKLRTAEMVMYSTRS